MQNPQGLPNRETNLATRDPADLSSAQSERGRDYVQLRPGDFRGELRERSTAEIGLLHERWSCALRVRCARPTGYVAFGVTSSLSQGTFCAVEVAPDGLLEVTHDWELTTRGPFEIFSLAVARPRLELALEQHSGGNAGNAPDLNRVLGAPGIVAPAARLRRLVGSALASGPLDPIARRALEDELVHLAVDIRTCGSNASGRLESRSRRRRAVRSVEEYLDAHEREVPSIGELCAVAGVSERTLEYAFREQLDTTLVRYQRVRRLNRVRRELRQPANRAIRVTEVAMRWGFWELGRFARAYHQLFGELPSQTVSSSDRAAGAGEAPA